MSKRQNIAMWSGPRNLSTALMRSFGNRKDVTAVYDEPFYASYLITTNKKHPMSDEVIGSQDIIRQLIQKYDVVITTSTPTGLRKARKLFQDEATIDYAPWDFLGFINRFFNFYKPDAVIIFETEIWPSMISQSAKKNIPFYLVNGRLSKKSYQAYAMSAWLVKDALQKITNKQNSKSLNNTDYGGSTLIGTASTIYRHAYEKTKPNGDREPGYQERDYERLVNRMRGMEYRFDPEVDKGIFLFRLNKYRDVNSSDRHKIYSELLKLDNSYEETISVVDGMYDYPSDLLEVSKRVELLDASIDGLNESTDPFIIFARNVFDEGMERENKNKARSSLQQKNISIFIINLHIIIKCKFTIRI